jgi:RNA polymerase sigma-70 factor (ECF subfamily)
VTLPELYDRYSARAFRVAQAACANAELAEEAVRQGFLAVWESRSADPSGEADSGPRLLTLVRQRAIEIGRRNPAAGVGSGRSPGDRRREPDGSGATDLAALLTRLPDVQNEVIVLAVYGELTAREIAGQLGLPLGTVNGQLRLGMHALREGLTHATA